MEGWEAGCRAGNMRRWQAPSAAAAAAAAAAACAAATGNHWIAALRFLCDAAPPVKEEQGLDLAAPPPGLCLLLRAPQHAAKGAVIEEGPPAPHNTVAHGLKPSVDTSMALAACSGVLTPTHVFAAAWADLPKSIMKWRRKGAPNGYSERFWPPGCSQGLGGGCQRVSPAISSTFSLRQQTGEGRRGLGGWGGALL